MATSQMRVGMEVSGNPPRTPGPLGMNDAADPSITSDPGDSPGPLGINDTAAQIVQFGAKKTRAAGKFAGPPKGYLIRDGDVKAMLPDRTWQRARTRVNELFKKAGGLNAVYVSESKVPSQLKLIDAVVRIYSNSALASFGFRRSVYNQLNTLGHKIPAVKSLALAFNKPERYTVKGAGISYSLKKVFGFTLVCVTEAAVQLAVIFNLWAGVMTKKTKTTLATISTAPEAEQLSLGIALGNVIAHEIRHQLGPGDGLHPIHAGSGLGADEPDFWDPKLVFSKEDEAEIRKSLTQLREIQSKYEGSRL